MSLTRPTGEQLRFSSSRTGEHILDDYLEAVEKGGRTLSDILDDLFNPVTGHLRDEIFEWRITDDGALQFRVGDYLDAEAGWHTLSRNPTLFSQRGVYAPGTLYRRTDIVILSGRIYLCRTEHTATTPEPDPDHFTLIFDPTQGFGLVYVGDHPPLSPAHGQLWVDTRALALRVFYDDGTSQQWVDPASPPKMQALTPTIGAQNVICLTLNWTGSLPPEDTVRIPIAVPFTLPAQLEGSVFRWAMPPALPTTLTLSTDAGPFGTVTIHPDGSAVIDMPTDTPLLAGDTLMVALPSEPDPVLSGLAMTLRGTI